LRNDLPRLATDFRIDDGRQKIRTDEFVQHRDRIVQQLIAHADLRFDIHAIL
jgi:hypothetical protein